MRAGPTSSPPVLTALREMARERPVEVTVRGGCMARVAADGARVAVAPARLYWPGDVVVFQAADGRLLAHRLLGYRLHAGSLACVTRGDGCPCHDAPVPFERLLGRVVDLLVPPADRLRAALACLRLAARRLRSR